jgi:hypothetical protein
MSYYSAQETQWTNSCYAVPPLAAAALLCFYVTVCVARFEDSSNTYVY